MQWHNQNETKEHHAKRFTNAGEVLPRTDVLPPSPPLPLLSLIARYNNDGYREWSPYPGQCRSLPLVDSTLPQICFGPFSLECHDQDNSDQTGLFLKLHRQLNTNLCAHSDQNPIHTKTILLDE